jgi:hypothetical protein
MIISHPLYKNSILKKKRIEREGIKMKIQHKEYVEIDNSLLLYPFFWTKNPKTEIKNSVSESKT